MAAAPAEAPSSADAALTAAAGAGAAPGGHFASLYVGDLSSATTEADLFEVFNPVGPVASIRVCRDSMTRKSLGYAYVNFHNVQDAERALDTLNYTSIKGRSARIMWCQRDPSTRKSGQSNIFVKCLDVNIDNKALYDTFSLFGNILSCKVATDEKGVSKGYGFVQYETEEAAGKAIDKVNGMQIGTRTVTVTKYVKQTADSATFTNLYVKQFPLDWDEEKMLELFTPLGTISSSVLMHDKRGRPFAFINYEDGDAAAKAVDELNGKDMGETVKGDDGEEPLKLFVGRAQTKQERAAEFRKQKPEGVTLYIKNLSDNVDDDKLKELFDSFGEVSSARVVRDDEGKSRGFGFVGFSSAEEATRAVTEMHLKVVEEKPLYVGLSERRAQRQARLEQRYNANAPMGMPAGMGMMPGMRPPMMGMRPGMQGMMGKGMMRPGMPMMPMMQQMQQMQMMQMKGGMKGKGFPGAPKGKGAPKGGGMAPPGVQKQMLGERIYSAVHPIVPELAGKITGMMLEMENNELAALLDDTVKLNAKVEEARRVLQNHGVRQ